MIESKKRAIVILLTISGFVSAHATPLQSHASIQNAVKQFVLHQQVPLNNITVTLTSLTQQINLPKCTKALQVSMAPGTKLLGHASLNVGCTSTQPWKIRVAAHVDGLVDALVARHPLTRGTQINDYDIEFVSRRYSQLNHGYYASAGSLVNKEAKRNIKAGQILTPSLVRAQKLVLRGQHITIVAQNGGLKLRVKGKAMMDGQQGQTIKVTNLKSKKLIYAQVISAGVVKVNF